MSSFIFWGGLVALLLLAALIGLISLLLINVIKLRREASLIRYTLLNFEKIVFDDLYLISTELRCLNDRSSNSLNSFDKTFLQNVRSGLHKRE